MDCQNPNAIEPHSKGDRPLECQKCLDYLNVCRLMIEPKTDSIASNQTVAMNYADKFVHEMSLQEIFMFQKRFEALAAKCSLVYSERLVKDRIPDPKAIERKKEEWSEAIKEQKDKQRPPKERKILSDRDKAIQALVTAGLPMETATQVIDERMKQLGRVAQ